MRRFILALAIIAGLAPVTPPAALASYGTGRPTVSAYSPNSYGTGAPR